MSAQFPNLPETPNLGDVFSAYPQFVRPLVELLDVIMRQASPLSVAHREMLAAYVSGLNSCAYCHGSHTGFATALGVDPGSVAALLEDIESAEVDTALKPLLQYAKQLTEAPGRVTGAHAEAVFAAGWGEDALFSVVSVCGVFNMMNRLVEGTGCSVAPGDMKRWSGTYIDSYVAWAESSGLTEPTA